MSLKTPVAFFIFKRPKHTQRVFDSIRRAKPETLFVIADGPRASTPGEERLVNQTRSVLRQVDWPCKLRTNLARHNMGCQHRLASGLTWVFRQVPEAIILEDDNLPHDDFFRFCSVLLERYRDDDRIFSINGTNYLGDRSPSKHSYFFSHYTGAWGWATWRRSWRHYDPAISRWPALRESRWLRSVVDTWDEFLYWRDVFDAMYRRQINSYAYPVQFASWRRGGLSIVPTVNLISNIGCGDDATHTRSLDATIGNVATDSLGKIEHPQNVSRERQADIDKFLIGYLQRRSLRRVAWRLRRTLNWRARRASDVPPSDPAVATT